jgi:hypothetical protein
MPRLVDGVLLTWITRYPFLARLAAVLLAVAFLLLASAGPASAATSDPLGDPDNQLDGVTDSNGVPANRYKVLPYDRGGFTNPQKLSNSWWISLGWESNFIQLKQCIWLLDWTLSFQWVDFIAAPAQDLGDGLASVMQQLHIVPLALGVAAFVCGLAIVRGKYATGFVNIGVSILFAVSVATGGILANPVDSLVGDDGALQKSAQFGGELAVRITNDGDVPAGTADIETMLDQSVSQQLVDIFLRTPAQLVSFGKVLEGDCVAVFDAAMVNAPENDTDDTSVRDAVGGCDLEVQDFIDFPTGQLPILLIVSLAMFGLLALAVAFVAILFFTVLVAAYKTILLIFQAVLAIFPTTNRSSVWYSAFDVLTALALVAASVIFLASYLRLIIGYMQATAALGTGQYTLILLIFLAGVVLAFKMRRGLAKTGRNTAARLARFGFSTPTSPKQLTPIDALQAAHALTGTVSRLTPTSAKRPAPTGAPAKESGSKKEQGKSDPTTSDAAKSAATSDAAKPTATMDATTTAPTTTSPAAPDPAPAPAARKSASSGTDRVRAFIATGSKTALQVMPYVGPAAKGVLIGLEIAQAGRSVLPAGRKSSRRAPESKTDRRKASAPPRAERDGSASSRVGSSASSRRSAAPKPASGSGAAPRSSSRTAPKQTPPVTPASVSRLDRGEQIRAKLAEAQKRVARSG